MADLTDKQREDLWESYMKQVSHLHGTLGNVSKADVRSAIDALDTYIDDEDANINAALPTPFRTEAADNMKSLLLQMLTAARYEAGA